MVSPHRSANVSRKAMYDSDGAVHPDAIPEGFEPG